MNNQTEAVSNCDSGDQGQSLNNATSGPTSKNKAKNDAKRAAKMEKYLAKQEKLGEQFKKVSTAKPKTVDLAQIKPSSTNSNTVLNFGEKKDMSQPMANGYDPIQVEAGWYAWWEKSGFFKPECHGDFTNRPKFTIVMPPPNVTGSLHLGHATMLSVEDALARWHRMKGEAVLYLPGCDHAGIATQVVVEKKLKKEQNITRHDLGREAFLAEVWKWKDQYGHRIYDQLRRMGASSDWTRACFTLDPMPNKAVVEAFIRLYNSGKIFRADRLVNWCGKLRTALSDLEVEMKEIEGGALLPAPHGHDPKRRYQFGMLTYFAYAVEDGDSGEEIIIATTRPETLFADTAVCVNPTDERYKRYHGRKVIHPVMGTSLPIIVDEAADPQFGTGALKVSPAHDPTDFALGKKHKLPFTIIFDENNRLTSACGPQWAGMARYDAREAVIELCRANGTLRDHRPYPMTVPVCSRSGDFLESRMMPQWWLDCREMAARAVEAYHTGELGIDPPENGLVWRHWLDNIKDWCLSRQLWWGHRIPAYRVFIDEEDSSVEQSEQSNRNEIWVAARSQEEALQLGQEKCPGKKIKVQQDEDVLDTWFSSGLWPFSTLGWPDKTPDFQNFYPNQLLETGKDILFFWVARMVMMGLELTGKLPFSKIFLHAIVRDAHGRKMSKSLGNVIDPLDVIDGITLEALHKRLEEGNLEAGEVKKAKEGQKQDFPHGIPQCGTDALRFGLCSYIAMGNDINLDINRVEGYRRFCNKLWNAVRFALLKLGSNYKPLPLDDKQYEGALLTGGESLLDKWILTRLYSTIEEVDKAMNDVHLMAVTQAIRGFWLYDLCDVYIEAIKPLLTNKTENDASKDVTIDSNVTGTRQLPSEEVSRNVLYLCLEQGLRLLHPFMPFITEELYQRLPRRDGDSIPSISLSPYPKTNSAWNHPEAARNFNRIYDLIKEIRRLAMERNISAKNNVIHLSLGDTAISKQIRTCEDSLASLIKAVGILNLDETTEGEGVTKEEAATIPLEPKDRIYLRFSAI